MQGQKYKKYVSIPVFTNISHILFKKVLEILTKFYFTLKSGNFIFIQNNNLKNSFRSLFFTLAFYKTVF